MFVFQMADIMPALPEIFLAAVALVLVGLDYFRRGSVVLAGSVLLAAFLRLFLPEREAGLLVVRSRKVDVLVLGVLGALLALFAFWVPPPR